MASSRDAGHHRESVGLHPTPAPNNHSTEICESLLSACPAFYCRFLRKLFLPDSLRRSEFPWCALVVAALLRKVILAFSRRFCCQRTCVFTDRIGESSFRKVLSKYSQIVLLSLLIGIRKGGFIYSFLKFSKFHTYPRSGASWLGDEFHRANRQKRTVLHEGMGSRIPIKMPGMKSPNGISSYSGRILP